MCGCLLTHHRYLLAVFIVCPAGVGEGGGTVSGGGGGGKLRMGGSDYSGCSSYQHLYDFSTSFFSTRCCSKLVR